MDLFRFSYLINLEETTTRITYKDMPLYYILNVDFSTGALTLSRKSVASILYSHNT